MKEWREDRKALKREAKYKKVRDNKKQYKREMKEWREDRKALKREAKYKKMRDNKKQYKREEKRNGIFSK